MTTLRIVHRTGYEYPDGATASYNQVRMTPRSSHEQLVMHNRVEISPTAWLNTYKDYWGTTVTNFEVHERHDQLRVTSTSTVDVERPCVDPPGISWEEVRAPDVTDRHAEMLQITPRTEPGTELRGRLRELRREAATPGDLARAVSRLVHDEVAYVSGSTNVHTRAQEAWAERAGVCQDMAHLMIGALRTEWVPARYVSGYLMPVKNPEEGTTYKGESHAWVEYWDGAWTAMDPTNDCVPGEHHVEVAKGRDYGDVSPLQGIFTGRGTSAMFVSVELTLLPPDRRAAER